MDHDVRPLVTLVEGDVEPSEAQQFACSQQSENTVHDGGGDGRQQQGRETRLCMQHERHEVVDAKRECTHLLAAETAHLTGEGQSRDPVLGRRTHAEACGGVADCAANRCKRGRADSRSRSRPQCSLAPLVIQREEGRRRALLAGVALEDALPDGGLELDDTVPLACDGGQRALGEAPLTMSRFTRRNDSSKAASSCVVAGGLCMALVKRHGWQRKSPA